MADHLDIETRHNNGIVVQIDDSKYLGLGIDRTERIDLFLFAMALGIEERKAINLKSHHGLIKGSVFNKRRDAESEIFATLVNELIDTDEEDRMSDEDYAYEVAEKYANAGFSIMDKWFADKTAPNVYDFIKKMDKKYRELFPENT